MGRRRAVSLDFPLPPIRPPPHSRHKRHRRCRRFLERNMVTISLLICASECFLMLLWLLRVVGCCMSFSCCCSILPLFPQCAACWCACRCLSLFLYLFIFPVVAVVRCLLLACNKHLHTGCSAVPCQEGKKAHFAQLGIMPHNGHRRPTQCRHRT